jgi:hypothetical protein
MGIVNAIHVEEVNVSAQKSKGFPGVFLRNSKLERHIIGQQGNLKQNSLVINVG